MVGGGGKNLVELMVSKTLYRSIHEENVLSVR